MSITSSRRPSEIAAKLSRDAAELRRQAHRDLRLARLHETRASVQDARRLYCGVRMLRIA